MGSVIPNITDNAFIDETLGLYLSIDGGGTKTNVSIAARRGHHHEPATIIATGFHRSSNFTDLGIESAVLSIGEATLQALRSLPTQFASARQWQFEDYKISGLNSQAAPFVKIWAGLSGVDSPQDVKVMKTALSNLFGISSPSKSSLIEVTNDCDLLSSVIEKHYRSNHKSKNKSCLGGIVLIAGTGSIATLFKPVYNSLTGSRLLQPAGRLGGYGYLLGDEGSSFYVGRETVKTILHALDRGEDTESNNGIFDSTLLKEVLQHFKVKSSTDLLAAVYSLDKTNGENEHDRKVRLAEVSKLVMKCAFPITGRGDKFALKVMLKSAEKLSELVAELCNLHHLNPNQLVLCLGGGMWGYSAFQSLVLKTMNDKWGANWGWAETIKQPDQLAAILLAEREEPSLE
ncbi:hypothetical protein O181_007109 [Austropuccinia psidii MF-1]|uniref:GlcNAc kinase n=1 Tax=Austropuccinia psidii MF-1 TaxID=1389203 RepID=A0A9Q3GHJ3_9BASI|nr:hypothetical protein [Austropuccinia psidii MF-1]